MEMFSIVGKSSKHFGNTYRDYRPIFVNSGHNYKKMTHLRYCLLWSLNCMYDECTEILLSC